MNDSETTSKVNPWKVKCAQLIREFAGKQKNWELNEKLLCRTIVRLTIAADGFDETLNPHLRTLNNLLKGDVLNDGLRQEIDHLTEKLIHESNQVPREAPPDLDAELLFRFVKYCALSGEEKNQLENVQARFCKGEFSNISALFAAIEDIFFQKNDTDRNRKSGLLGKLLKSRQGNTSAFDDKDHDLVCNRLIRLLDELEVPSEFKDPLNHLKEQLVTNRSRQTVETWLDDLIDLLVETKSVVQDEQKEIEGFFTQLTSKLQDLEQQALGTSTSFEHNNKNRNAFDAKVSDRVQALKSDTSKAIDLKEIKQSLSSQLDQLAGQFNTQRQEEQRQNEETAKQLSLMTDRLQDLEMESQELRTRLRVTYNQALLDPLTGLPNRLAYDERIAQEHARWQRFGNDLTMLVWDIDHFKSINDRFGHLAGDKALKAVAGVLEDGLRKTDFIARFGGEEFVSLLVGTEAEAALSVANRIRDNVKGCGFNSNGKPVTITISCGISQFAESDQPEAVFSRADKALYQAKKQGRDRCVIS